MHGRTPALSIAIKWTASVFGILLVVTLSGVLYLLIKVKDMREQLDAISLSQSLTNNI
jgi:hypothetical protein